MLHKISGMDQVEVKAHDLSKGLGGILAIWLHLIALEGAYRFSFLVCCVAMLRSRPRVRRGRQSLIYTGQKAVLSDTGRLAHILTLSGQ